MFAINVFLLYMRVTDGRNDQGACRLLKLLIFIAVVSL